MPEPAKSALRSQLLIRRRATVSARVRPASVAADRLYCSSLTTPCREQRVALPPVVPKMSNANSCAVDTARRRHFAARLDRSVLCAVAADCIATIAVVRFTHWLAHGISTVIKYYAADG